MRPKTAEFLSEEFASYEEAAEFWNTHDTTNYLDEFAPVPTEAMLQKRHFEVRIDEDLMEVLHQQAQAQGVEISQLVSKVLREQLGSAA